MNPSPASSLSPVLPVPARLEKFAGALPIGREVSVDVAPADDMRVWDAVERLRCRWVARTAAPLAIIRRSDGHDPGPALAISVERALTRPPELGDDESYTLEIDPRRAVLQARTTWGALRGLATLTQWLEDDGRGGWRLPAGRIEDRPRFPWRGLMLDVCRHWLPPAVVLRTLDGMELAKLNVLHLHLTDDQGFRVESRRFLQLHEHGAAGDYFTQGDLRTIVAHAAARGIRVVPEFDVPGHATSWLAGFPALGSGPGPHGPEQHWGVFSPVLDPTNEDTFRMLDGFIEEMAGVFPDRHVHIGGDENNGKHWSANPRIQAFSRAQGLKDNAGLHAYFNRRMHALLARHGKQLVGWDEILDGHLPPGCVVQSWRGPKSLVEAAQKGFGGLLSSGFYLDHCQPAAWHYAHDPLPAETPLAPEAAARVLGGEAAMWTEWVSAENLDSRIWPRAAAIAERLWSPRETCDGPDLYRRLDALEARLDEAGLRHRRNLVAMRRRLVGEAATEAQWHAWQTFFTAIEPRANYRRSRLQRDYTQATPLVGIADCAQPEPRAAREFAADVERSLFTAEGNLAGIAARLSTWAAAAKVVGGPLGDALGEACAIGLRALASGVAGPVLSAAESGGHLAVLTRLAWLPQPATLAICPPIRSLVAAATLAGTRATPDWRSRVAALALPPAAPALEPLPDND